jgi:hypothetical protein
MGRPYGPLTGGRGERDGLGRLAADVGGQLFLSARVAALAYWRLGKVESRWTANFAAAPAGAGNRHAGHFSAGPE